MAPGVLPNTSVEQDKDCITGEPKPSSSQQDSRPRPFVQVIPEEDVPMTPTISNRDVSFGKAWCKAGREVWRDQQGRIRVCTIRDAVTLFGLPIARDAYTHFHEDGRPYQTELGREIELENAKKEHIPCSAKLAVFSPTGAIEFCTLAKTMRFNNIQFRKGESISFHSGGELAGGMIDLPWKDLGIEFPAATRMSWFPDGKLHGGWLAEPMRIQKILIRWDFTLHPNGRLHTFELAEPRTFQGQTFAERTKIKLRADSSLEYAEFIVAHGFLPHGEMWQNTKFVNYDCRGHVSSEEVKHWQAAHPPHPRKR